MKVTTRDLVPIAAAAGWRAAGGGWTGTVLIGIGGRILLSLVNWPPAVEVGPVFGMDADRAMKAIGKTYQKFVPPAKQEADKEPQTDPAAEEVN